MRSIAIVLLVYFFISAVSTNSSNNCGLQCQIGSWLQFLLKQIPGMDENGDYVIFRIYTRDRLADPIVVYGDDFTVLKHVDFQNPIKMVIHGWRGHEYCTFTRAIKKGFLSSFDCTMISVDWSRRGSLSPLYPAARRMVPVVARDVANFLDNLNALSGIDLKGVHIIGHSLGAHIAGISGRLVINGTVGRITGVDPAGPYFSVEDRDGRLTNESAEFVDVIHTSSHFLGYGSPLGHVDFYPNGGHVSQPGCGPDLTGRCSHNRSFYFYIESLSNPGAFPAVSCSDWENFKKKNCSLTRTIFMGEHASKIARGVFYLATNNESPFGLGSIW